MQGSVTNSHGRRRWQLRRGTVAGGFGALTANGWAVQGGVKINLPMIAPGDDLWLEGAYSKGGEHLHERRLSGPGLGWRASTTARARSKCYDGVVNANGKLKLTNSWSVMADYPALLDADHPSGILRQLLERELRQRDHVTQAGFAEGAACPTCVGTVTLASGANFNPFSPFYMDGAQWQVGSNITWSPVKNLDIGVEVIYVAQRRRASALRSESGISVPRQAVTPHGSAA